MPNIYWIQTVEVNTIAPGIQALRDAGLWLSDSLVNLLKQQAGE
ncbi:hypothetical protein [Nostoc sp. LPT]|nr:hypothetical protein [Nostoc sp. LPT]